jgi:hypothetical protein
MLHPKTHDEKWSRGMFFIILYQRDIQYLLYIMIMTKETYLTDSKALIEVGDTIRTTNQWPVHLWIQIARYQKLLATTHEIS